MAADADPDSRLHEVTVSLLSVIELAAGRL
jgi:hypothetical protein